jgi:hypothetical protein
MKKQQLGAQGAQGPKLDISKTLPIHCDNEECGNDMFIPAVKFRKIPKLMTGAQNDSILPIEVYMCTACGNVNAEFDLNVGN